MSPEAKVLELDCGNNRAKWRLRVGGAILARGAVERASSDFPERIASGVDALSEMRVCNVAGRACEFRLETWARGRWGLRPRFAVVTAAAAGVSNRYDPPAALGADRWLACLAAFRRQRGAVCVIDCGTAVTADAVDGRGHFLGGYIAPGPRLLAEALSGAAALPAAVPALDVPRAAPGYNTVQAMRAGVWGMLAGLCRFAVGEFRGLLGVPFAVCVTGGHGEALLRHLRRDSDFDTALVPELVLDGLELGCFRDGPGIAEPE